MPHRGRAARRGLSRKPAPSRMAASTLGSATRRALVPTLIRATRCPHRPEAVSGSFFRPLALAGRGTGGRAARGARPARGLAAQLLHLLPHLLGLPAQEFLLDRHEFLGVLGMHEA